MVDPCAWDCLNELKEFLRYLAFLLATTSNYVSQLKIDKLVNLARFL